MYGTIARIKIKSGKLEDFLEFMKDENRKIPGAIQNYIYQMDEDESILYLVVMFSDKQAYLDYSESETSSNRYQKMLPLMEIEPEWHDGQVILHHTF